MPVSWSQEKYIKACLYSAEALNEKTFPGSHLPFFVHLSLVSMEVIAALQVEKETEGDLALQCALLHDVIEYGGVRFDDLCQKFGNSVALGVRALTRNRSLPDSEQMKDSLDRIQKQPYAVWIVKMADRITNLHRPQPEWTSEKIQEYWFEAVTIYERLNPASKFLAERLFDKIKTYEHYFNPEPK